MNLLDTVTNTKDLIAEKYNGEIVIFDRISNISTSNIIQTIKNTENTHD